MSMNTEANVSAGAVAEEVILKAREMYSSKGDSPAGSANVRLESLKLMLRAAEMLAGVEPGETSASQMVAAANPLSVAEPYVWEDHGTCASIKRGPWIMCNLHADDYHLMRKRLGMLQPEYPHYQEILAWWVSGRSLGDHNPDYGCGGQRAPAETGSSGGSLAGVSLVYGDTPGPVS